LTRDFELAEPFKIEIILDFLYYTFYMPLKLKKE